MCVHEYGSVCLSVWGRQGDRYPAAPAVQPPVIQFAEESPAWVELHVRACTWTIDFRLSLRSSLTACVSRFSSILSLALHTFLPLFSLFLLLSTPIYFSYVLPLPFTYCLALYPSQSMSHIINAYSCSSTGQLKSTVRSSGWWPPTWKEQARHRLICQCQSWL